MHQMFVRRLLASLIFMGLLLALLPASAQAAPSTKVDWNDRFAAETGGTGFIIFKSAQQGSMVEIQVLKAKDLSPNHEYEIWVTVDFDPSLTTTFGSFVTNAHGNLKAGRLQVDVPGPGTYRLDVFLTHDHSTTCPSNPTGAFVCGFLPTRDPLLACEPALIITTT